MLRVWRYCKALKIATNGQILIADDDEVFYRLVVKILEAIGLDAFCQTNALDADEGLAQSQDSLHYRCAMALILGTELAPAIKEDCQL